MHPSKSVKIEQDRAQIVYHQEALEAEKTLKFGSLQNSSIGALGFNFSQMPFGSAIMAGRKEGWKCCRLRRGKAAVVAEMAATEGPLFPASSQRIVDILGVEAINMAIY
jgi:hypothetical protein